MIGQLGTDDSYLGNIQLGEGAESEEPGDDELAVLTITYPAHLRDRVRVVAY